MGFLDQVLGNVLGGNTSGRGGMNPALMSILMTLLTQRGGSGGGLGGLLGGLAGGLGGDASRYADQPDQSSAGGFGGLSGLLEQFTRSGHGDIANSWISSGPNQQIAPHELENVLGGRTIDSLSSQTGMDRGDLLSQLSAMLPQAIDQLTPHGRMPTHNEMQGW